MSRRTDPTGFWQPPEHEHSSTGPASAAEHESWSRSKSTPAGARWKTSLDPLTGPAPPEPNVTGLLPQAAGPRSLIVRATERARPAERRMPRRQRPRGRAGPSRPPRPVPVVVLSPLPEDRAEAVSPSRPSLGHRPTAPSDGSAPRAAFGTGCGGVGVEGRPAGPPVKRHVLTDPFPVLVRDPCSLGTSPRATRAWATDLGAERADRAGEEPPCPTRR